MAGALLQVGVPLADAQQRCSPSTAPTVRNPGYPGSTPYSSATIRPTSNCTGPAVETSVQPDPFYGQAYVPATSSDPLTGGTDATSYAALLGAVPLSNATSSGYGPLLGGPAGYGPGGASGYGPSGAPGYAAFPPGYSPYGYGSGYGYA